MLFFSVYGCMLCLVRYPFVISTSVINCLGRFVPEMTYYMSSETLNLTKLKLKLTTDVLYSGTGSISKVGGTNSGAKRQKIFLLCPHFFVPPHDRAL